MNPGISLKQILIYSLNFNIFKSIKHSFKYKANITALYPNVFSRVRLVLILEYLRFLGFEIHQEYEVYDIGTVGVIIHRNLIVISNGGLNLQRSFLPE